MFKVMLWSWLSFSKQIRIRSFKWGTVHPCRLRGCKNIRGQSWRSKKICQISRTPGSSNSNLPESAISYRPPTLTSDIFAASSPTRANSTSYERSGRPRPKSYDRPGAYNLPHFCSPLPQNWTLTIEADISPTFVHFCPNIELWQ